MRILGSKNQSSDVNGNKNRFFKIKTKSDSFFSIENAREYIVQLRANAENEKAEQILGQKKDLLAQQSGKQMQSQQKVGAASVADIFGFNPIGSKQKSIRDKSPDEVPIHYRKYYKLLLKLKDNVRKDLSKLTNDNLAITVGTSKQEWSDPDTDAFDSACAINLMSSEQEALTEIEDAIQRIHNGTYGICELTGKPIEAERLSAVPFARFSIEGQKEKEKQKQKPTDHQRGAIFHGEQSADELSDFEVEEE